MLVETMVPITVEHEETEEMTWLDYKSIPPTMEIINMVIIY